MKNPRDDVCGCCGRPDKNEPFYLRHLIGMLRRQEEERKKHAEGEKKSAR